MTLVRPFTVQSLLAEKICAACAHKWHSSGLNPHCRATRSGAASLPSLLVCMSVFSRGDCADTSSRDAFRTNRGESVELCDGLRSSARCLIKRAADAVDRAPSHLIRWKPGSTCMLSSELTSTRPQSLLQSTLATAVAACGHLQPLRMNRTRLSPHACLI